MGLFPDGSGPARSRTGSREQGIGRGGDDFSFWQAFKTNQFWLLGATWVFLSLSIHMVFVHVVPYAVDTGISPMKAAVILGLIGASNIPGRIVVGQVSDAIGRKTLAVSTAFAQFGSLVWLMWAGDLWSLYVFGIVFGFLFGGSSTMVTVIIGDIFGTKNIGTIMGVLSGGWAIGAAVGPRAAVSVVSPTRDPESQDKEPGQIRVESQHAAEHTPRSSAAGPPRAGTLFWPQAGATKVRLAFAAGPHEWNPAGACGNPLPRQPFR